MNPQSIRKIDVWIGKPLCFALTACRWLVSPIARILSRRSDLSAAPIRKILFIKMIEQGATVLAHGAITRAVNLVGRENVYFWVFKQNREILDLLELVPPENVLEIRTSSLLRCGLDLLATLWRIRRLEIDATVDMEFFARASAALAFLTGAKRRVGLHRFTSEGPYRGDLLTHRVAHNPYLHTTVAYGALVEALTVDPADLPLLKKSAASLGFATDSGHPGPKPSPASFLPYSAPPPPFHPRPGEQSAVQAILDRLAGRAITHPIALLNPNASDMLPLRKWPTDRFIELGRQLLDQDPALTIIITGAPDEQDAAHSIATQINASTNASAHSTDRCISVAGETSLRQLLVLYTMADVLVTNDSGPGHFAAMTEIDSIVLFGPETPALFGPIGRRSHTIWAGLACSPCVNALNHRFSPCGNNVCMQEITVQQVLDLVRSILQRRASTAPLLQINTNNAPNRPVLEFVAKNPELLADVSRKIPV